MILLATTSALAVFNVVEVPTPFLDFTPKYKAVVDGLVTPAKLTKIADVL